jgi:hypothetical protein
MLGSALTALFKCGVAFLALILFAYAEREVPSAGMVVALMVTGYLVRRGGWHVLLAPLLFVLQLMVILYYGDIKEMFDAYTTPLVANFFTQKTIYNGLFVTMLLEYLMYGSKVVADDIVDVRPYEKEIRRLLLEHDHSKLHTVDTLLEQNKGHEELLLHALKKEYGVLEDGDEAMLAFHTANSNSGKTAPWEATAKLFQQDVLAFVEAHDPGLKRYLPKMFEDYSGKEEELLKVLHREYGKPYVIPAYARKYGQAPITIQQDDDDDAAGGSSNKSPFRTRDETMLEQARREARAEIQAKLDRYGRR